MRGGGGGISDIGGCARLRACILVQMASSSLPLQSKRVAKVGSRFWLASDANQELHSVITCDIIDLGAALRAPGSRCGCPSILCSSDRDNNGDPRNNRGLCLGPAVIANPKMTQDGSFPCPW